MNIILQLIFGFFFGVFLAKVGCTLDKWTTHVFIISGNIWFAYLIRLILN